MSRPVSKRCYIAINGFQSVAFALTAENAGSRKCWVIVKAVPRGDRARARCHSHYLKFSRSRRNWKVQAKEFLYLYQVHLIWAAYITLKPLISIHQQVYLTQLLNLQCISCIIFSVKWIQSHGRMYFVNSEQRKNVGSLVGIKLLVLNKEERC